ncbi:peptidase M23 [Erythrobacter sp. YT30]|nr:peptidase M23 [Erythrobacter sp. YT30]
MRSQGNMRFLTVTTRLQVTAVAISLAAAFVCVAAMLAMAWGQYRAESDLASFQKKSAHIATTEERIDAYGNDLENVVEELKAKQDFLDETVRMLPVDVTDPNTNVTDSSSETAETVEKIGALLPQARGLAEIEARQIAFVERLTRFADARARKAEEAMRKLNLDPKQLARNAARTGRASTGGPLELLATAADGSIDPRFERLGLSLARMNSLERALEGIPHVVPAAQDKITSDFGYRRDPFNGRGAMHGGIDFKGKINSPIFAAATGEVVFAGWKGGYGRVIDIRHANGMVTRYAHLYRIGVKVGDAVQAGDTIGGLGSSGRSTGPHLHFEVRINDKAVNPRPFLESASDVLKEVRATSGASKPRTATAAKASR